MTILHKKVVECHPKAPVAFACMRVAQDNVGDHDKQCHVLKSAGLPRWPRKTLMEMKAACTLN